MPMVSVFNLRREDRVLELQEAITLALTSMPELAIHAVALPSSEPRCPRAHRVDGATRRAVTATTLPPGGALRRWCRRRLSTAP
jgi:hypothetical protein